MEETYRCVHTVLNEFLKQIIDLNETWCNQHWITSNKCGTTKCRKNASCILFVIYEITMFRNFLGTFCGLDDYGMPWKSCINRTL